MSTILQRVRVLGIALGLLFLASLSLCANAQSVPRSKTLIIAQNFDPQTLWPNGTTASTNLNAGAAIVEPLFWINPANNKMEGVLATSYTMVSPTVHRIELRKGVKFTNGEAMNADAVVHTLNVFIDKVVTPAYSIYAGSMEKFEKVDDYTVLIHTKGPYPAIRLAFNQV